MFKGNCVAYMNDGVDEFLIPMKSKNEDLEVEWAWKMFNANPNTASA